MTPEEQQTWLDGYKAGLHDHRAHDCCAPSMDRTRATTPPPTTSNVVGVTTTSSASGTWYGTH